MARRLGYVPDPMLASLAHYRNALRPVSYHATLAWVTNYPTRESWRDVPIFRAYCEGVQSRAAELGYRVEEFWLREPGMTPSRATQILAARGITGLVIAPQPEPGMSAELDWEKFSAVAIGYSLAHPALHLVGPHQYRAIRLAMEALMARGYRRPGLVMLRASDERVDQNWQAGFMMAQLALARPDRVSPLLLSAWDEARFATWFRCHRPDALLTKFPETLPALRRLRVAVPKTAGVAFLTRTESSQAGLHENPTEVGAAATNYLIGMIQRNERGLPRLPHRLLMDAQWVDGRTVRPLPAGCAARP